MDLAPPFKSLLFAITLGLLFVSTFPSPNCKKEQRCKVSRIFNMKGADCYKRDMRNIPQCLPSDVEIVDLSTNRIRKLLKSEMERYSSLKMLYLSDNVIVSIDDDAFDGKSDLNTLDLSLNAISKLPSVVFQLPSLKSLYLSQNLNINIVEAIEDAKPITSPLVQLDISYVMVDDADMLPELGLLPYLTKYNISGNKLQDLSPKHFAGLCKLKILDTSNVTVTFGKSCDCWTINKWLTNRKVIFNKFECDVSENECADSMPDDDDLNSYVKCNAEVELMIKKSRIMKIVIPIVAIALAILLILIIYLLRKRRQKSQQKQQREMKAKNPLIINSQSSENNTFV